MVNTTFEIGLKNGVTIPVDFAVNSVSEINNKTRGDTASIEAKIPESEDFEPFENLTVTGSYTIPSGKTETYATTTVESGATLTVEGTLNTGVLDAQGTVTGDGQVNVNTQTYTIPSGETEFYDTLIINDGAEVEVNGILVTNEIINNGILDNNGAIYNTGVTPLDLLLSFDEFAGKFTVNETLGSKQSYSEFIPTDLFIESLLIKIQPNDELEAKRVRGVWGLIENVTDSRNNPLTINRWTIDVTILARFEQYTNHSAVEADLKH